MFKKAKQASPCIIFFAIAPVRGFGDSRVVERVISQLLTELDGIEELKGVVVLAATNIPDILDPATLRSGRFDVQIKIPVPDQQTRLKIFEVHTRGKPLAPDVDLKILAEKTEGMVGADIEAICREAAMSSMREFIEQNPNPNKEDIKRFIISSRHFEQSIEKVKQRLSH